jgi:glyceraldehyde-3-phosphate dehydrogenase/erythrose-4-phosphate dehydrogenase
MSTVHAVTSSQSLLDKTPKPGEKDLRKNRSSLNNIILTSTNAAHIKIKHRKVLKASLSQRDCAVYGHLRNGQSL